MLIAVIVVLQCFAFPFWRTLSLLHAHSSSTEPPVEFAIPATTRTDMPKSAVTSLLLNVTYASNSKEDALEKEEDMDYELESDVDRNSRKGFIFEKGEMLDKSFKVENLEYAIHNFTQKRPKYAHSLMEKTREIDDVNKIPFASEVYTKLVLGKTQGQANNMQFTSQGIPSEGIKFMNSDLSTSDLSVTLNISSNGSGMQSMVEMQLKNESTEQLKNTLPTLKDKPKIGTLSTRIKLVQPTSITQMNSLLLQSYNSSACMV